MTVTAPPVGSVLGGRYVLLAALGEAPGHVEYRARDQELEVEIALWWLRPELFPDPVARDAVIGAGVELRHVNDPELRQCFGVGGGPGGLWAIWRLASGPGPMPGAEPVPVVAVRHWIDAAARGLLALHRHGLVHGRLTAHDVVSVGGALRLGGGGLWRDVDPAAAARRWGEANLAPELRHGRPATEASDVWSLAAIALEMVAATPASSPDQARIAARRHPQLAAVLVGAMSPDPGRRPGLPELAEAARNAAEYPYVVEQPAARGKGAARSGASTELGVPPAPRLSRPVPVPPAPAPAPPAAPVKPAMPTPARTAIAAAAERARTAPPGQYVVAAVSMKTPKAEVPEAPTGETPMLPKAKIRPLSEVASARTFSVAPGQMGYLAPPKAVSDARKRSRRFLLVLVLIAVLAAGGGVALALLL